MSTTSTKRYRINETVAALAPLISDGGQFYYRDLIGKLGVHRDTINAALLSLENIGAISYQRNAPGRPLKDLSEHGPATWITVVPTSWVWSALGIEVSVEGDPAVTNTDDADD